MLRGEIQNYLKTYGEDVIEDLLEIVDERYEKIYKKYDDARNKFREGDITPETTKAFVDGLIMTKLLNEYRKMILKVRK